MDIQNGQSSSDVVKFPKIWPGFVIVGIMFILELCINVLEQNGNISARLDPKLFYTNAAAIIILLIMSIFFFLERVYRTHKAILIMSNGAYPISPRRAVGYSFIPFYNLYWIYKWPTEIMTFVKNRSDFKTAKKWVPGTILLISALILSRIGNSIGMAVEFWILSYLVGLLRKSYSVNPAIAAYNGKQIKITDGPIVLIIIFIIAVIVLLAAIAVPNFIRARETAMAKVCVSNLEQIQNAKIAWANNTKSEGMGIPTWKDLIPAYLKEEPKCPKEGKYSIGFVSSAPTCSVGNNNSRYPEMKHEIR